MLTANERAVNEAAAKQGEEEKSKTFKLTEQPNRICWSMRVHAGDQQQEIHVEADPNWTVDELLRKLLNTVTKSGFISSKGVVAPTVNREDAIWSLIECKSRGQSTAVERQKTLMDVGLETLQNTHLTRGGLAATSVSPIAVPKDSSGASRRTLSATNSSSRLRGAKTKNLRVPGMGSSQSVPGI